jgi:sulfhydrogenase subunit gamma (sulfur reductase)
VLTSHPIDARGPNPYRPQLGTLVGVKDLATNIRMFRVELEGKARGNGFTYRPGQFAFVSAFGVGEAPFGLASTVGRGPALEFAVNNVGTVTSALHRMGEGDIVGVRGPFGNWFPLEESKGKNVVLLGGGIGGAPLRPVIQTILDQRTDYDKLTILWAARSPSLLIFTDEYDEWRAAPDTELHLTVDRAEPLAPGQESWPGHVGLITELLEKVAPSPEDTVAILCGPPAMIKFTLLTLHKLGFTPEQMVVTLEAKMKCGMGKCGRCNLGEKHVCTDGPVFSYTEIAGFLESF